MIFLSLKNIFFSISEPCEMAGRQSCDADVASEMDCSIYNRERWNLPHSIFSLRPRTKVDATLVAPMHAVLPVISFAAGKLAYHCRRQSANHRQKQKGTKRLP